MVNKTVGSCTASVLGFGAMRLPVHKGKIDEQRAAELVDYAMEKGVNYYDTAYMYHDGQSEGFIGRALKRYDRGRYTLADKMPSWLLPEFSTAGAQKLFDEQLKRTGAEYFDYYLCHSLHKSYWNKDYIPYLYEFLEKKKEQGTIKKLGFSFHDDTATIKKIADHAPWDFAQIQLNYYDYAAQDAAGQYAALEERGIPVVVMEPVRGGALADLGPKGNAILKGYAPDKSIASWAMRFAMSFKNVFTVLSGMSDLSQVRDNVETASAFVPLSEKERAVLAQALEAFKSNLTVPCTGCRYCMDCPSGVDIPAVFKTYNAYNAVLDKQGLKGAVRKMGHSGPSACVGCRKCCHCPQNIDIPAQLQEIVDKAK